MSDYQKLQMIIRTYKIELTKYLAYESTYNGIYKCEYKSEYNSEGDLETLSQRNLDISDYD